MHVERRFEKLTDDPNLASWCIIDGDKVYPFGPQESAESCLSRITAGKDRIEGYGAWPKGVYPVTELEWCKDKVFKKYHDAWGFTNLDNTHYCISRGYQAGISRNWELLAREATELEAWREAEQIVAIEGGRRQSAKIEIKETVAAPPYHGMWVAITDFNPEPTAEPEPEDSERIPIRNGGYICVSDGIITGIEPPYQRQYLREYNREATSDLLLGQIRESSDGVARTFSSRCTDCGFTEISDGFNDFCTQCGSRTITHTTYHGSNAPQQTVRAGFEQGSI